MRAHPTFPVDDAAAPPAAGRGKDAAGPLQYDESGLPSRIRQLVDLFKTQKEAAAFLGCAPETLQNWIAGRTAPGFEAISRLALAKGVSLEWLATGLGDVTTGSCGLLSAYSALPADVRKRIDQAVELVARAHLRRESDIEGILRLTLSDPQ